MDTASFSKPLLHIHQSLRRHIPLKKTASFVSYLNKRVQQDSSKVPKLVLVGPVATSEYSIWFRLWTEFHMSHKDPQTNIRPSFFRSKVQELPSCR